MAQHRLRDRVRKRAIEVGSELGMAFRQGRRFVRRNVRAPRSVGGQPPFAFAVVPPISEGIIRRQPRTARRGEVLFDAEGRPVSVRNATNIRRFRLKKRS